MRWMPRTPLFIRAGLIGLLAVLLTVAQPAGAVQVGALHDPAATGFADSLATWQPPPLPGQAMSAALGHGPAGGAAGNDPTASTTLHSMFARTESVVTRLGSAVADTVREIQVPLPAAVWLLGSGLGLLGAAARYRSGRIRRAAGTQNTTYAAARPPTGINRTGRALRRRLRSAAQRPLCATDPAVHSCTEVDRSGNNRHGPSRPRPRAQDESVELRFEELCLVLLDQPAVEKGRRFGRDCLKLAKKAFLVCDSRALAFRVGADEAPHLLRTLPRAQYWNPKNAPQPKRSWLCHPVDDSEALVMLSAAAYEHALQTASRPDPEADSDLIPAAAPAVALQR